MNYDSYGEVVNGEGTYKAIAMHLKAEGSVIIGWTDNMMTHFDILFTPGAYSYGSLQGGVLGNDLFVSIMRRGAFGFEKDKDDTHAGYYGGKLGGGLGSTGEALAELINGVKKELKK